MDKQNTPIDNFFPIYDVICEQVKASGDYEKHFSTNEYVELINKLRTISVDKNGRDMIYVLIRVHSLRNSSTKFLEVPFGGEKNNNSSSSNSSVVDIKFDIRNFPNSLNRILSKFCDLHLRKIKEDNEKPKIV